MTTKPKILATHIVASTSLFKIQTVDLKFSNGEERVFERIRGYGAGAVMALPMLDDDRFLMVREYCVGTERYELGLPKGRLEHGEDIHEAANRELKEEVGHGARKITSLKRMSTAPGFMGAGMHLVLAQDLYPEILPGDEPEPLEVVEGRLSEIDKLVAREDFSEARSIAALYITRDLLHG